MELFKRILCPIDFSDFSTRALRYAIAFAQQYHSELIVYHCVPRILAPVLVNAEFPSGMPAWTYDANEQLQKFLAPFQSYNLNITTKAERGRSGFANLAYTV